MKLSKAKKLFKAGTIQICQDIVNSNLLKKIIDYEFTNAYRYYYMDPLGVCGSNIDDCSKPKVNLSDIKPSKKKTLKKRVKTLEEEIRTFPHKYARYENPLKEMLRATTEPGIINDFEENKWYKSINPANILYNGSGYGFTTANEWQNVKMEDDNETRFIPATLEEVKERLIAEAKQRGFVHGVVFDAISTAVGDNRHLNCVMDGDNMSIEYGDQGFIIQCNTHQRTWGTNHSNPIIYKQGKWAVIH